MRKKIALIFMLMILITTSYSQVNLNKGFSNHKFGVETISSNDKTLLQIKYGRQFNSWFNSSISAICDIKRKDEFDTFGGKLEFGFNYIDKELMGNFNPFIDIEIMYIKGMKNIEIEQTRNELEGNLKLGVLYKLVLSDLLTINPYISYILAGRWRTETTEGFTDSVFGNTRSTPEEGTGFEIGVKSFIKTFKDSGFFIDLSLSKIENRNLLNTEISYLICL